LLARGFHYGTAPGALVIGWNGGHTAGALPDGAPRSTGAGGGGLIGGGGPYQPQFSHHMYLPVDGDAPGDAPAPVLVNIVAPAPPAPDAAPADPPPPAPDAPPPPPAPDAPPPPPAPDAPPPPPA